jgi:molybdopterin/thiamine biosynthesis adenylyltransferase
MAGKFHHEEILRGTEALAKLRDARVTICGAGALGSNLADALARQGAARLRVIDRDRVEEHNVGTQLYGQADVGVWKVDALRKHLFRAAGVEVDAVRKELTDATVRPLLADTDLVVDVFDNAAARACVQRHARATGVPTLHAGLAADYCEVVWDEAYRVPRDAGGDVCDYPMARNLILLAVAVTAETIVRYVTSGERPSWSATLADLRVLPVHL